ncbi:hypothetical protein GYMLUDRAFT_40662 [Collybiopsis luxurians FD-317 M1]|uniref:Uncharacterized protein n=1 Tax=Collybiopsis luxurians FD-317 M1 TaxID=944289 RepID=A0A0D0D303_9AGAR|nr:hypothetical protein GYMLUDRAFT_40662 [Collybiopsis luxurians FD-317 M1]
MPKLLLVLSGSLLAGTVHGAAVCRGCLRFFPGIIQRSIKITGATVTPPGTLTLTATKVVPSMLPTPPYMTFVTETTVWT